MKSTLFLSVPLAAALGAAAFAGIPGDECTSSSTVSTKAVGEKDIVTTAVEAGQFRTLAAALKSAELIETLKGKGPFTVFAPTDEAFAKLPKGTVESLLKPENRAQLTTILTYHVVPGRVPAKNVIELPYTAALNGQRLGIEVNDDGVKVAGAKVVRTDITCSNGIIHVVDSVLMPNMDDIIATAVNAGSFKTLAAALEAAGLVEALQGKGPFTVFAPTDEAFAALPAGTVEELLKPENLARLQAVLKYHVVPGRIYASQVAKMEKAKTLQGGELAFKLEGSKVMVGKANIRATDLDTTNGVIHVIDRVLLPQ